MSLKFQFLSKVCGDKIVFVVARSIKLKETEGKKIIIFYLHFRPRTIMFSTFFLAYPSFFYLKKIFIPILGHQYCGSEWKSHDMGKTCEHLVDHKTKKIDHS